MWQLHPALALALVMAFAGAGIATAPRPNEGNLSGPGVQALETGAVVDVTGIRHLEARSSSKEGGSGSNRSQKGKAKTGTVSFGGSVVKPASKRPATTVSPSPSKNKSYKPPVPSGSSGSGAYRPSGGTQSLFGAAVRAPPVTTSPSPSTSTLQTPAKTNQPSASNSLVLAQDIWGHITTHHSSMPVEQMQKTLKDSMNAQFRLEKTESSRSRRSRRGSNPVRSWRSPSQSKLRPGTAPENLALEAELYDFWSFKGRGDGSQ